MFEENIRLIKNVNRLLKKTFLLKILQKKCEMEYLPCICDTCRAKKGKKKVEPAQEAKVFFYNLRSAYDLEEYGFFSEAYQLIHLKNFLQ